MMLGLGKMYWYAAATARQAQPDPTIAFQQYESERFPRTKAIALASRQSGKMGELKNPVAVGLRNTFMKAMGSEISNSFKSFHVYYIESTVLVA